METLLYLIGFLLIALIFGVILNPYFWQGFRNSKFIDDMTEDMKKGKEKRLTVEDLED